MMRRRLLADTHTQLSSTGMPDSLLSDISGTVTISKFLADPSNPRMQLVAKNPILFHFKDFGGFQASMSIDHQYSLSL
jgi:hypothetical protein